MEALGPGTLESQISEELQIGLRLVIAAVFGGLIGYERELRQRAAGLRTHALTSLAAAVFTVLTFEIYDQIRSLEPNPSADPIRLIQAITAGVSFLAAGTIIHGSGTVRGLTTGAGMWLAGAVGVAVGAGYYFIATVSVVLALIIFVGLRQFEQHWLETKEERK